MRQLSDMTVALNEILQRNHLPEYYAEPRFHVSLAWWPHVNGETPIDEKLLKEWETQFGKMIRKHELAVDAAVIKIGQDATRISLL